MPTRPAGDSRAPALGTTSRPGGLAISVAQTEAILHPERALELPAERALVIADLHLGKALTLRAHGIPVPPGGTRDDLARLDRVLARSGAAHLVVLGDLGHSRHAWDPRALAPVLEWRARWPSLAITLVRGNHDRHAGDPPPALGIHVVDPPARLGHWALHHEPPAQHANDTAALYGHLHPTVRIDGRGRQRVRLPCFVQRDGHLILPAFSAFTGAGAWHPRTTDRVWLIVEDEVVAAPAPAYG